MRVLGVVLEASLPLLLFELPKFVQAEFLPDVLAFRKYVTSSSLLNPEKLKLSLFNSCVFTYTEWLTKITELLGA